jgi:MFS family permease
MVDSLLTMWSTRLSRVAPFAAMATLSAASLSIIPLFPAFQTEHGISTASLGLISGAGFAVAMVVELLVAPQADRGHARSMMLGGVASMAVALVGLVLATDTWQFVVAKGVTGIGYGLFVPAMSAVLIRQNPSRSGESLGKLGTADLAGIAIGPLVTTGLLEIANADVALGVMAGLVVAMLVPLWGALSHQPASAQPPDHREPLLAFDLLRDRRVVGAVLLTVAVMIPVGAYDSIWPRFMEDIGAGNLLIGISFTVFAIPFAFVATPAGRLADRIGGLPTFLRGMAILLPMIVGYAFVRNAYAVTGIGFMESSGQAMAFTAAAATMAHVVPPSRAGASQGLRRSAGTLAAAVVSVISAPLYASGGATVLFLSTAIATVSVVAVGALMLRRGGLHAHAGRTVIVGRSEERADRPDGLAVACIEA